MDKTNMISVYEEVSDTLIEWGVIITFLDDRNMGVEPSVQLYVKADNSINVSYYLTEAEAQTITAEEVIKNINFLVLQEKYRRTITFANALSGVMNNTLRKGE